VQHVVDDDSDDDCDDDGADASSEVGSGVVILTPADACEQLSATDSPLSAQVCYSETSSPAMTPRSSSSHRQLTNSKRSLADAFGSGHVTPSHRTPTPSSSSSTVRALLTGMLSKNVAAAEGRCSSGIDRHSTVRSPSSRNGRDLKPDSLLAMAQDSIADSAVSDHGRLQEGVALNFSKHVLDRPTSRNTGASTPDKPRNGVALVRNGSGDNCMKVKEEYQPLFPGLEFMMGAPGTVNPFDISSTLAAFGPFIDQSQLISLANYDPHRFALYSTLASAATNGCSVPSFASTLLNGSGAGITPGLLVNPINRTPEVNDGPNTSGELESQLTSSATSSARYSVSNCHNDGLTMHLSRRQPPVRRRERFGRRQGSSGTATKVKDIIMYDDSVPLHKQRGNRIEGDFMLDALHVDGKKRRRRTAEDTLTPEEIAEYMGSSTCADGGPNSGAGLFTCRYCGEVTSDLSRYFAHTLASHGAYVCHQCGKSFTTKSSLLRHRPIHTGMRRFACSICRKSFYRKDKCKAHIKRHLGLPEGGSSGSRTATRTPTVDPLYAATGQINMAV
jgi:KRAB domain-containing zinc finger protein